MIRVLCSLLALLALSCSTDPEVSENDKREYEASIEASGPGWRHWFPRPAWFPEEIESGQSFVSARVVQVISQCSGGVTISSSDLNGVANSIENRISGGRISVEEIKRSVIGINFGNQAITSQTVELYRAFTDCVTARVNDNRGICEGQCDNERVVGLKAAFNSHSRCMEDRRAGCLRDCIQNYGIHPDQCRANYCRVETNMTYFLDRCETPADEAEEVESQANYCKQECISN